MKVINPNASDEYKCETDYRKIPREYLNPCIPQGRGMVKWQAFKTLPEQYELLEQYIQDQNKVARPSLSDHQLNDLTDKLILKMYHELTIEIRYDIFTLKRITYTKQMFTHKHYIYMKKLNYVKLI